MSPQVIYYSSSSSTMNTLHWFSVPGSLLRSTKEGKLGYFLGTDGSQLDQESFGIRPGIVDSRIDVALESGSTQP